MTLYTKPSDLPHSRLGLSVGRRVGNAVTRNRLKRLIREAFRLNRHAFPAPYDMVVVLRPHETRTLNEYEAMLTRCLEQAHESREAIVDRTNPPTDSSSRWAILGRPAIWAIHLYRATLSPIVGWQCRFHPTCSRYAEQAFKTHNPLYALYLTIRRLTRCHPPGRARHRRGPNPQSTP